MSNALWLDSLDIGSVDDDGRRRTFSATCNVVPEHCPKCGNTAIYRHGTETNRFMDTPAFNREVFIRVGVQRYRCRAPECRATFAQPLPDMDDRRQMTRRCVEYIAAQGIQQTYSAVARQVGVHEKTVREICNGDFEARMKARQIKPVLLLGIDELTLAGKNRRRTIFVDVGIRRPLDILETMSRRQVERWLWALPGREAVQIVTMDMWRPYRDAVRATMPQAKIVIDKFHVLAPVGLALDRARNRARRLGSAPRKNPRAGKVLLQTSRHRLTPMRQTLLEGVLLNSPLIAAAWHAKEAFYDIYAAEDQEEAEHKYDRWRANIPEIIQPDFGPIITMVDNWREEIFRYFQYPITNAYTEGANGIIKVANRAGRGYAFANIRSRALLHRSAHMRECSFCKAEMPASGMKTVEVWLPHWRKDELIHKPACGNCHYVFYAVIMNSPTLINQLLSTANSE